MPPRKRAAKAASPAVDETVVNQENPGTSDEVRPSTETTEEPEVAKVAEANDVDITVHNQETPVVDVQDRSEKTNEGKDENPYVEVAPANEVDPTVENQMNPGVNMVNRTPEDQVVTDSAGIEYKLNSGPYPELVVEDDEEEKNAIKQSTAVLDARDHDELEKQNKIYFVKSGLTAQRRVWKKGETLYYTDEQHEDWMDMSDQDQEERFGHVKFEKR
jgi:hypothetical protein